LPWNRARLARHHPELPGSIAGFERAQIQKRVRPASRVCTPKAEAGTVRRSDEGFAAVAALSNRHAAPRLGMSHTAVAGWRAVNKTAPENAAEALDFPASM
jgi:hypothetical protein